MGRRSRFTVKSLLEDGTPDIIEHGSTFINSVLGALGEGEMSTVLAHSFGPNTVGERGRTPWIRATAGWCLGAIGALLGDVRVGVYYPWRFGGLVSLYLAVWDWYIDVVRLLLACARPAVN